jgi:hypothetical protein
MRVKQAQAWAEESKDRKEKLNGKFIAKDNAKT